MSVSGGGALGRESQAGAPGAPWAPLVEGGGLLEVAVRTVVLQGLAPGRWGLGCGRVGGCAAATPEEGVGRGSVEW